MYLRKLSHITVMFLCIVVFVVMPAKIFTYAEAMLDYKPPKFEQLKHSEGKVQWKGGRITSGTSGVLVNLNYFFCRVIKEGYSSCSPCYFTRKCDAQGRDDVADQFGKHVKITWYEYERLGRVVFSVEMDGVDVISYQDAVVRYASDVERAKDGIVFCALLFVLGVVMAVLYFLKSR